MCLCPAIVFHQRTLTFRQLTRFGHLCIMSQLYWGLIILAGRRTLAGWENRKAPVHRDPSGPNAISPSIAPTRARSAGSPGWRYCWRFPWRPRAAARRRTRKPSCPRRLQLPCPSTPSPPNRFHLFHRFLYQDLRSRNHGRRPESPAGTLPSLAAKKRPAVSRTTAWR